MNIGQIARQQQMMYNFINRGAGSAYQAQIQSQLASLNSTGASSKSAEERLADLRQSMGLSGLEGRTIREMAQYQLQTQQAQRAAQPAYDTGIDVSSLAQQLAARRQYTPISDEATTAMQQLALEDAKNSVDSPAVDAASRANLIREHLQGVTPSKRAAAFNTMNKVWESELDRIGDYIKEKDSNWTNWGDKFDTSILNDYKLGVNIWI